MKKLLFTLAMCFLGVCTAFAADVKSISVNLNSSVTEEVTFAIQRVSVSNKEIVRAEAVSGNPRALTIVGQKAGMTDVVVQGDEGRSQTYNVTVVDDLRSLYNSVCQDLEEVPEIEVSINGSHITLRGEISSIENVETKDKVVEFYGNGVLLDQTRFSPTAEVMLNLQKNFEKAGYTVVEKGEGNAPGQLYIGRLSDTSRILTIQGTVYSPADQEIINRIIAAQPWLTTNPAEDGKKVQASVNVTVDPVMLQLDVVYVAVNKQQAKVIGLDWGNFLNGAVNLTAGIATAFTRSHHMDADGNIDMGQHGVNRSNGSYRGFGAGGSLVAALGLLGGDDVSRIRRAGYLVFKSNDTPEFRRLHNGGTLYLSSMGQNGSGQYVSELKDVDYGLIVEVKGGLTGADNVSIELKQELSYPSPEGRAPTGTQFDLKRFKVETSLNCKLGDTIAIGGLKELASSHSTSEAIPYMRNIPVVKWLFSQDRDDLRDEEIVALVCVRPMSSSSDIDPVAEQLQQMKLEDDENWADEERKANKNKGKWYQFWKW